MNPTPSSATAHNISSPVQAIHAVRAHLTRVPTEMVELSQASARVLAQVVIADRDSPSLDVSAMDGFAIRMTDVKCMTSEHGLPVTAGAQGEANIGDAPVTLMPEHAARIVTGAPIPIGADVVVRHEDVTHLNARVRLKIDAAAVKLGANIRRQGENAKCGDVIAPAGILISAATIGALASFGVAQVRVHRRVRVAIVSTGDELVPANAQPQPWQIRDSNGPVLQSLLRAHGWIEIISCSHVRDDAHSLASTIEAALHDADAVIMTGGVSMGHRDCVAQVCESIGAQTVFHKLPQRPGRPMLAAIRPALNHQTNLPTNVNAASHNGARLILGLPGNPVSVMATARRLGIEMLGALAGLPVQHFAPIKRAIANGDNATLHLWWYRLVSEQVNERGETELNLLTGKSSGDIATAAQSVGFIEVAPGEHTLAPRYFYAWMH